MNQNQHSIRDAVGRDTVHPFPARMAPGIALKVLSDVNDGARVLDPMMGSGTVLAVARAKGHRAIGVDLDPLAVLTSRVWTSAIDTKKARQKAIQIAHKARDIFRSLPVGSAYPKISDDETRAFIRYWFDPYSRRQLTALASAIGEIRDPRIRDVLWCAFSRLIITKQAGASLARDLAHSRPHRSFLTAPAKPFKKFLPAVERVLENCLDSGSNGRGPATRVYQGDARVLPLPKESIDLVLTSPPYLNAIDYFRCSKFSLVWMGHQISSLRESRGQSVGSEIGGKEPAEDHVRQIVADLRLTPKLSARHNAILSRYVGDMQSALAEVARVLTKNGKAVYVIGENTIRGTFIPNAEIIKAVARHAGLELCSRHSRDLPSNRRYLPPPSARPTAAQLDNRLRREVVMTFRKAHAVSRQRHVIRL